jgi:hypothetical protein
MTTKLTTPISIIVASFIISAGIYLGLQFNNSTTQFTSTHSSTINYQTISEKTPHNYQLYNFYYEDLDEDNTDEVIAIYEEHESLMKDFLSSGEYNDYFRVNPIKIRIFDLVDDTWINTEAVEVSTSESKAQHPFIPYNLDTPYKINKKNKEDWITIFIGHASFHGMGINPNIFTYNEKNGIERVETSPFIFGSTVFVKKEKMYFSFCNWLGENNPVQISELDLSKTKPEVLDIDLSDQVSCNFIGENTSYGNIKNYQEKTEELFNIKGIFFPIE